MLWLFLIPIAVGLTWLALIIFQERSKQSAAKAAAASLSERERSEIISFIEGLGRVQSRGFVGLLARGRDRSEELVLTLPSVLSDFPWCGQTLHISANDKKCPEPVAYRLEKPSETSHEGEDVYWMAVPAIERGAKGRVESIYSNERYLKGSAELRERLEAFETAQAVDILSYLLSVDGEIAAREPFDSLRCGLPPSWIQSGRFHKCELCKQPMRLILQTPSFLFSRQFHDNGALYLFGCPSHPEQLKQDQDWL